MTAALVTAAPHLPAMAKDVLDLVRLGEARLRQLPQVPTRTAHLFHGGIYSRTIRIPAGAILTGALIKIATTLSISGDVTIFTGGDDIHLQGYHLIPASAGRKQAFRAHADTYLTMSFKTDALTVEQAESEFTDEGHLLLSRAQTEDDIVVVTGE